LFSKTGFRKIFTSIIGGSVFLNNVLFGGIENKLIYYPVNKNMAEIRVAQSKINDVYFYSRDGIRLNALYISADNNKPTVIYCHGQGENISEWQNIAQFLANNGYGVFMLDYRGHGKSTGSPSESGLYIDLESSIKYLTDNKNVIRTDIILWGRSLGGAIVADVASRDKFKGVILESTFTNIRDEAIHLTSTGILESNMGLWSVLSTKVVKFIPITQKFSTDSKIYKIKSPLLIGHSINDTTVPVEMAYKLGALNPYAKLYISETGSHHESDWFFGKIQEFLDSLQ